MSQHVLFTQNWSCINNSSNTPRWKELRRSNISLFSQFCRFPTRYARIEDEAGERRFSDPNYTQSYTWLSIRVCACVCAHAKVRRGKIKRRENISSYIYTSEITRYCDECQSPWIKAFVTKSSIAAGDPAWIAANSRSIFHAKLQPRADRAPLNRLWRRNVAARCTTHEREIALCSRRRVRSGARMS